MVERPAPVHTVDAPAVIGPYSQAMVHGRYVFASGQLGLDPVTGELTASTAGAQAARALAYRAVRLSGGGL